MIPQILRVLLVLAAWPAASFGLIAYLGLDEAWDASSIVVVAKVSEGKTPLEGLESHRTTYKLTVRESYKGAKAQDEIELVDPYAGSTSALFLREGKEYLIFVQTAKDRENTRFKARGANTANSCLRAVGWAPENAAEVDAAIAFLKTYRGLPAADQRRVLLEQTAHPNPYIESLVRREVLHGRLAQALPMIQKEFAEAKDEGTRIDLIGQMHILGDPRAKDLLLACLRDPASQKRVQTINALLAFKDGSLIPAIREYIHAPDPLVAVEARAALLQLGDPEGKALLLETIGTSAHPDARYNALHYLNWNYNGAFTEAEKATIRKLASDPDENIARVAGFIIEKWK